MTANATAAVDTGLPAMAGVLAGVVMSDLLVLGPRRRAAMAGEFVTPVGVVTTQVANNFFDRKLRGAFGFGPWGWWRLRSHCPPLVSGPAAHTL